MATSLTEDHLFIKLSYGIHVTQSAPSFISIRSESGLPNIFPTWSIRLQTDGLILVFRLDNETDDELLIRILDKVLGA